MLDIETRHRIDTARDILVGKVPDPKSQVEQITIALIYKFMDDMDAEAEELGGRRKFFAGDFARYGWAKIKSPAIGGNEMIALYAEGILRMPENPGIPPFFRDIFKNAYLPYRDPETLKSFLKIIDEFTYDHSERLGDAFEYLLSVLGSQGDAGQFRTPRHIIDFVVRIIDPQKGETILDPACGTAGFLVSAYKHILGANTDTSGNSTLTPHEKGKLAQNFKGYDISPDMVRLSLVNLYLHGFIDPRIYEYDTLTSEERWNEFADVILANPPFMSPKGGIKPHKRFSVQAKRSEVLFVDYMAEHLMPSGRAGIIVPEGIIFQSQNAYKDLRKLLVENSLVAVISLPSGCFNPYSGVKTSILILDKLLAKKAGTIAFFKVENDGFGLGAQRREIEKNDLPLVQEEIGEYFRRLRMGETIEDFQPTFGLIVEKEKVAANGDYNLSGERYREIGSKTHTFPLSRLGDICIVNPRKSQLADLDPNTLVSFVPMADLNEHCIAFHAREKKKLSDVSSSYTYFEDNDVLLAKVTPCFENGKAGIARGLLNTIGFGSSEYYVLRSRGKVLPEWIYFCVMHPIFRDAAISQMTGTGGLQRVPRDYVENFQIPLPPLEVQKEIVAEIERYQKVIDGARAVLENYRPHIPINPDWPMVLLGDHFSMISGGTPSTSESSYWDGDIPWVSPKDMKSEIIYDTEDHLSESAIYNSATKLIPAQSVICVVRSGILKHTLPVAILSRAMCINQDIIAFKSKTGIIISNFLFYILKTKSLSILADGIKPGVTVQSFYNGFFKDYKIPAPSSATQQAIVAEIEAEQALVAGNKELIERFEKKIQATLARIWGEDV